MMFNQRIEDSPTCFPAPVDMHCWWSQTWEAHLVCLARHAWC